MIQIRGVCLPKVVLQSYTMVSDDDMAGVLDASE